MNENEAKEKLQAYIKCQESQEPADVLEQCDKDCDNCELCYAQGLYEEHKEAVQMAIKALEEIQQYRALGTPEELRVMKAYSKLSREELFEVAVALMGFQEYRQIGTLKECRTAMEKQTPKRPDYEGDGYADGQLVYDTWICPCCGKHYEIDYDDYDYCPNCGQRIDWGNEENE